MRKQHPQRRPAATDRIARDGRGAFAPQPHRDAQLRRCHPAAPRQQAKVAHDLVGTGTRRHPEQQPRQLRPDFQRPGSIEHHPIATSEPEQALAPHQHAAATQLQPQRVFAPRQVDRTGGTQCDPARCGMRRLGPKDAGSWTPTGAGFSLVVIVLVSHPPAGHGCAPVQRDWRQGSIESPEIRLPDFYFFILL
ncbi:MAG: hypothetical protein HC938_15390 [Nitrospira sp.]|nr:hypothetical protein [Nitrospira sp.]